MVAKHSPVNGHTRWAVACIAYGHPGIVFDRNLKTGKTQHCPVCLLHQSIRCAGLLPTLWTGGQWLSIQGASFLAVADIQDIPKPVPQRRGRKRVRSDGYLKARQCWRDMLRRCYDPNHPAYPDYGGRGIGVVDEWRYAFEIFLYQMGEAPLGLSLDRLDNDGHYSFDNCRWATNEDQANNRRPRRLAVWIDNLRNLDAESENVTI